MRLKHILSTLIATGALAGLATAQMQAPAAGPQADAAQAQPNPAQQALIEKLEAVQQRAQELQHKIERISNAAEEANPELTEMNDELIALYEEKLEEYGYPDEAELQELTQMQQQLQSPGDLDDSQRQQLAEEFNHRVTELNQARQQAQSDPQVQQAHQELLEVRNQTMAEVDPQTPALLREQDELHGEFENLRAQLQQTMQQAEPQPQP